MVDCGSVKAKNSQVGKRNMYWRKLVNMCHLAHNISRVSGDCRQNIRFEMQERRNKIQTVCGGKGDDLEY